MGAGSLENELGMRGREDRLVFVLLFLFWLLLNGKVTVEIILVGAAVSSMFRLRENCAFCAASLRYFVI